MRHLYERYPYLSPAPELQDYDMIAVAISGGKDSHQALYQTLLECEFQGVDRSRVVAIHADLGDVEWDGVVELAAEHARLCGVRFVVTGRHGRKAKRSGKCYQRGEEYGTILDHAKRMGFWPKAASRYCTSDHKRDPILRTIRALAREIDVGPRPVRILNVMGVRAGESRSRAKQDSFSRDSRASTGRVVVDRWLPIFGWSVKQVWAAEWAVGHPWHEAYEWGLPRLSCSFCVLASRPALRLAAFLRPSLAARYAGVERAIGRTLQPEHAIGPVAAGTASTSTPEALIAYARLHGDETIRTWEG